MNTYGYVGGNPLSLVDPTGENALILFPSTTGAAATGVGAGLFCQNSCGEVIPEVWDVAKKTNDASRNMAFSLIATLMAKGGSQNIDNEYVCMVQNKQCGDEPPCEWLRKLYNATKDKKERDKINKARKRFNCDGKDRFA